MNDYPSPRTHPLQESASTLMDRLYRDRRLKITEAMQQVLNGYYPSLEAIFKTLDHYAEEPLVREFQQQNQEAMSSAREAIRAVEQAERERIEQTSATEEERDEAEAERRRRRDSWMSRPDTWEAVKSVSLTEIESTVAGGLSELCGTVFKVKVTHSGLDGQSMGDRVEIRLVLTSNRWATLQTPDAGD